MSIRPRGKGGTSSLAVNGLSFELGRPRPEGVVVSYQFSL
jgi:hypothetical protein